MNVWPEGAWMAAVALVASVWIYKRMFSKKYVDALNDETPVEALKRSSSNLSVKTNDNSELLSCNSSVNGQDEVAKDSSDKDSFLEECLENNDKEIFTDAKAATVCSSTGDDVPLQDPPYKTPEGDSGGVNSGISSDTLITAGSWQHLEDEKNESETTENKKTFFTHRKKKFNAQDKNDSSPGAQFSLETNTDQDNSQILVPDDCELENYLCVKDISINSSDDLNNAFLEK